MTTTSSVDLMVELKHVLDEVLNLPPSAIMARSASHYSATPRMSAHAPRA